jgi:hypothetical protein
VVTYDEFGGAWDHVSPPGLGTTGARDQFGPGTRIPAILIARNFTSSGVDHTVRHDVDHGDDRAPVRSRRSKPVCRTRIRWVLHDSLDADLRNAISKVLEPLIERRRDEHPAAWSDSSGRAAANI